MGKKNKTVVLQEAVTKSIKQYFKDLNGEKPCNLHTLFLSQVEKPFLETVMDEAEGNQSQAAEMLGINRNTLRKKLKQYDLI